MNVPAANPFGVDTTITRKKAIFYHVIKLVNIFTKAKFRGLPVILIR